MQYRVYDSLVSTLVCTDYHVLSRSLTLCTEMCVQMYEARARAHITHDS